MRFHTFPWPDRVAAALVGLFTAAAGVLPHLLWSIELGRLSWFFNSYDEGFYGWSSLTDLLGFRLLSTGVLRSLYYATGANPSAMMVLADVLLPAACALAAYYLVRPVCRTATGAATASLFILVGAECLALRSNLIPHAGLHAYLRQHVVPLLGGPGGLLQIDNQTATFWLFRTPEPQLSWILMFLLLGWVIRAMVQLDRGEPVVRWAGFWVGCVLLALGYSFCTLGTAGALLLLSLLLWRAHREVAVRLGAGALLMIFANLALSAITVAQLGGESYVFPSRTPVLLLSSLTGLAAGAIALARWRGTGRLPAATAFALALGLTTLVLPNQQLVTGRMIYLMNFENFALGAMATLALLLAASPHRAAGHERPRLRRWVGQAVAGSAALVVGAIIADSQRESHAQYLELNRRVESYRVALLALRPLTHAPLLCEDFLATDILALKLGYRPAFLLARDEIFLHPLNRLQRADQPPANGTARRRNLYRYLAATATTPADFATRLAVLVDPKLTNWQDRTVFGSSLFNPMDYSFWFTHGRANHTDWITGQLPAIVAGYEAYLRETDGQEVLLVTSQPPSPWLATIGRTTRELGGTLGNPSFPLRAILVAPITPR